MGRECKAVFSSCPPPAQTCTPNTHFLRDVPIVHISTLLGLSLSGFLHHDFIDAHVPVLGLEDVSKQHTYGQKVNQYTINFLKKLLLPFCLDFLFLEFFFGERGKIE